MADEVNCDRRMVGWFVGWINDIPGEWHINIREVNGVMKWLADGEPLHEALAPARVADAVTVFDKLAARRIHEHAENPV